MEMKGSMVGWLDQTFEDVIPHDTQMHRHKQLFFGK